MPFVSHQLPTGGLTAYASIVAVTFAILCARAVDAAACATARLVAVALGEGVAVGELVGVGEGGIGISSISIDNSTSSAQIHIGSVRLIFSQAPSSLRPNISSSSSLDTLPTTSKLVPGPPRKLELLKTTPAATGAGVGVLVGIGVFVGVFVAVLGVEAITVLVDSASDFASI